MDELNRGRSRSSAETWLSMLQRLIASAVVGRASSRSMKLARPCQDVDCLPGASDRQTWPSSRGASRGGGQCRGRA